MKPLLVVTTAPWLPERASMVERLRADLAPQCAALGVTCIFHEGEDRASHIPNYTAAIRKAVDFAQFAGDVSHITLLPDDAILVPHFVEVLSRLIEHRPDDHLCLLANHPEAKAAHARGETGYYTSFGSVLFGGTLRVSDWWAYLQWREEALGAAITSFDDGVNLWLALNGRKTWKPLPSLCEHDTTLESTLGNAWQDAQGLTVRHSQAWEPTADLRQRDWREFYDPEGLGHTVEGPGRSPDVGLTFGGQHWGLVNKVRPAYWDIECMYEAARGGPVDASTHVMMATPAYAGTELAMEQSRSLVERDLSAHDITSTRLTTSGDSLVTRGRHSIMHEFLTSPCTHLLMWDADIEVEHPGCVRAMLATGHDVIGGAYPFRDGSGKVVANPIRQDGKIVITVGEDGCIPVSEVGTGFLMVSRKAIVELCKLHPELLYTSDLFESKGCPMWALFDTAIVGNRYLSEDWFFCLLWRNAGHQVYVYGPAGFRHWGKLPSAGHIADAWGLKRAEAAE